MKHVCKKIYKCLFSCKFNRFQLIQLENQQHNLFGLTLSPLQVQIKIEKLKENAKKEFILQNI